MHLSQKSMLQEQRFSTLRILGVQTPILAMALQWIAVAMLMSQGIQNLLIFQRRLAPPKQLLQQTLVHLLQKSIQEQMD